MANYYKGNCHNYGLVLGSFFDCFLSLLLSFYLFSLHIVFGLTAFSFSLTCLIFGLYYLNFGGRIKFSLKKKPSDDFGLYSTLIKLIWISLLVFIVFLIISLFIIFN